MNQTPRNTYKDGVLADALAQGYDIVQLKLDGWYCRCESDGNHQVYYSDTDREFAQSETQMTAGTYIGEYMRGTQWSKDPTRTGLFFVHDLLRQGTVPLNKPYAHRYATLRTHKAMFPGHWRLVDCFRIADQPALWSEFVDGLGYEGVVYRRSAGLPGDSILRHKKVFTLDGIIVGFDAGLGKHAGRLGALKVKLPSGVITSVGNGIDDSTREYIWCNQEMHLGKGVEFEANAVFASGNVRHGRFVRWRPSKDVAP